MEKIIVTISREFGSGGRLVGKGLAERLGIEFYDRSIITMAAERSGLSPAFIESSEEHVPSSLLYNLALGTHPQAAAFLPDYSLPAQDHAFIAQSAVIRELAEKESCVILGRCAGYLLRDVPGLVSVFLHGGLENRLERAAGVYGMERKGLADRMVKTDRARSNYHRRYTGENWYDVRTYDLVIDTAKSGVDGAVGVIEAFIKSLS